MTSLSAERADPKQFCVHCGEPHWLYEDYPNRFQPCYVEVYEDGVGVTTLRHRWPSEVCPADCKHRRDHG